METERIVTEVTLVEKVVTERETSSTEAKVLDHEVCGEGLSSSSDLAQDISAPHREIKNGTNKDDSVEKESSPRKLNSQINKKYVCKVCGAQKAKAADLYSHMIFHGPKKFKCDQCDKTFFRRLDLREHKHAHTGEKPYQCEICGRCYATSSGLCYHKRIHRGEKFTCATCNKVFTHQISLSRHLLHVHGSNKKFQCTVPECSKIFYLPSELTRHQIWHSGIKNFVCEVCGNRFFTGASLRKHMNIHIAMQFTCKVCGKAYYLRSSLLYHMNTHHNAESSDNPSCDKNSPHILQLTGHKKNVCSKKETVKNFKSFYCLICGAGFKTDENLKKHFKTSHSKEQPVSQNLELRNTTICPIEIREVQGPITIDAGNVAT